MNHRTLAIILVVIMVALIVGVDITFLRNHFGLRLAVNIAIVLAFGLLYLAIR